MKRLTVLFDAGFRSVGRRGAAHPPAGFALPPVRSGAEVNSAPALGVRFSLAPHERVVEAFTPSPLACAPAGPPLPPPARSGR